MVLVVIGLQLELLFIKIYIKLMKRTIIGVISIICGIIINLFIIEKAYELYIITKTSTESVLLPSNIMIYISNPLGMNIWFYSSIILIIIGLGILVIEYIKK